MKSLKLVTLFSIFLAMSGCASGAWTYLAADEDEDYGIGGTGIVAQNIASEAVGVVGEITGFGSIFVNGIEVEDDASTIISVNGRKVSSHEFEIGEVVEVLTRDEHAVTGAVLINVRHEVIGPISEIDRSGKRLTVLNQNVLFRSLPEDIESGDFVSVSGFRDGAGQVHASRITAAESGTVLVRGQLDRSQDSASMHGFELVFPLQQQPGNHELKIEGNLVEGKISVIRAIPDSVANFMVVPNWIVQGFPGAYASTWKNNEGLKIIAGQIGPVIFKVRQMDQNKPPKVLLLPDNLPKGASVSSGHKKSRPGNQASSGRGGSHSDGKGNSSGGNGDSKGESGNNSGGGGKH
jgi:hypothetical protein